MLSGSALLRVSGLLVAAGIIAALIQFLWPLAAPTSGPPVVAAPPPAKVAPPPEAPPAPQPTDRAPPPASVPPLSATPPPAAAPAPIPAPAAPPVQTTQPQIPQPTAPQPAAPPAATAPEAADERAQDSAGPRAMALVDLNTGTLAQLNGLVGGGSIGRAIIQRRPYTSVDQLLSKRVLSRATYERIKDQVTVQ